MPILKQRWASGAYRNWDVAKTSVIEEGDILCYNATTDKIESAKDRSTTLWSTNEAGTQPLLKPIFVGIADWNADGTALEDYKRAVPLEEIRDFTLEAAANHDMGQGYSFAKDAGGSYMYNQILSPETDQSFNIGYLAEEPGANATVVKVHFISAYHPLMLGSFITAAFNTAYDNS